MFPRMRQARPSAGIESCQHVNCSKSKTGDFMKTGCVLNNTSLRILVCRKSICTAGNGQVGGIVQDSTKALIPV